MTTARRLAGLALCLPILLAGSAFAAQKAAPARAVAPQKFTAPEYVLGAPNAPVTVVEYFSDTCSHCAHFDADVWPQIKARYVDTGKVKWVFREFLTGPEAVSAAGFVLARCAGKDRYLPVVEQIFRAQETMFKTGDWKGPFLKIARGEGLTEAQFTACLQDKAAYKALDASMKKAVDVDKIEGTPTLLINGKTAFDAVPSVAELSAALEAAGRAGPAGPSPPTH